MVAYQRFRIFAFSFRCLLLFIIISTIIYSCSFQIIQFCYISSSDSIVLFFYNVECVKSEYKMIRRLKLCLYLFFTLEITYGFLIIYHNGISSSVCNKFHNLPLPHILVFFFFIKYMYIGAPFIHSDISEKDEKPKIIINKFLIIDFQPFFPSSLLYCYLNGLFHVHCPNAFVMYIININVERQISFFEKTEQKN